MTIDFSKEETQAVVNRIERREAERRSASSFRSPERRQMVRRVSSQTADQMDAGRDHVRQVKSVQRIMEQIKSSALTVPLVAGTLAQQDFKPALIVDSVSFADNWGDAR